MAIQRLLMVSTAALLLGAMSCSAGNAISANPASGEARVAQASPNSSPDSAPSGMGDRGGRHSHPRIDWAAAAAKLGTTETELREALGLPVQMRERQRPNLQAAAAQLNVTEAQLQQALGITIDPQTGQPAPPRTRPNLETAAQQLGVTEDQLKTALGFPERGERSEGNRQRGERPRLDIAGAATKLGVTEQQIVDALGLPARPFRGQAPDSAPPSPDSSSSGQ